MNSFLKCSAMLVLTSWVLLSACSNAQSQSSAPFSEFRLGDFVIFKLNSDNEVVPVPRGQNILTENMLPTLTFNVQNRVVAELSTPDANTIPAIAASPFSVNTGSCVLQPTLQKTLSMLEKIALVKDWNSEIPEQFSVLSNCATEKALQCFMRDLGAHNWNDLPTAALRGLTLKGIVARLGACTGDSAPWETHPYFSIRNGKAYFYPAPIVAIYIYEGTHKSYNEAEALFDSRMRAVNILCEKDCYDTGIPASAIQPSAPGNTLESGKAYTAFLQLSPSKTDSSMRPVHFVAP